MAIAWTRRVRQGMPVFDRASDRVGTVKAVYADDRLSDSEAGYLQVHTGPLDWGKDLYIPFGAIRDISADAVYLAVDSDDVARLGWDTPPATNLGVGTPGYDGPYATRAVLDDSPRDGKIRPPAQPWDDVEAPILNEAETLQLHEEELVARKQAVETGVVTVTKEVLHEEQTLDVPVTREEVYIDRQPVDARPASDVDFAGDSEMIRVPVRAEQVELEKRMVVREEVHIGKRAVQATEQVSDTVRREELRVEEEGDVRVRSNEVDQPRWSS
jgi:uncharacterized protein (TIGR02271 family)